VLIIPSSLRDDAIKDELLAFDQFRAYIKENPESEVALTVKSAGRKRKAFCSLEADEEDGEDRVGSEASEGENLGGDVGGADGGGDGNEGASGAGSGNGDHGEPES